MINKKPLPIPKPTNIRVGYLDTQDPFKRHVGGIELRNVFTDGQGVSVFLNGGSGPLLVSTVDKEGKQKRGVIEFKELFDAVNNLIVPDEQWKRWDNFWEEEYDKRLPEKPKLKCKVRKEK